MRNRTTYELTFGNAATETIAVADQNNNFILFDFNELRASTP